MKNNELSLLEKKTAENLSLKASEYIEIARIRVQRSVNSEMVQAYWPHLHNATIFSTCFS